MPCEVFEFQGVWYLIAWHLLLPLLLWLYICIHTKGIMHCLWRGIWIHSLNILFFHSWFFVFVVRFFDLLLTRHPNYYSIIYIEFCSFIWTVGRVKATKSFIFSFKQIIPGTTRPSLSGWVEVVTIGIMGMLALSGLILHFLFKLCTNFSSLWKVAHTTYPLPFQGL